ncbi:MAG: 50S ribosomal protein L23 [Chloroflexi bacterium]|nr:50S ribosomal protein L23 [Chloroflexota bacterium]
MNISEVLLRPTITEKSTLLHEDGQYTFQVAPRANKTLVKQAVEQNFGVKVVSVNITVNRGKRKRYGPRFKKQPDVKKAVVTLRPGDRIDLIEGL